MDPHKVLYLGHLQSICACAETPTSLVEGKSLDEHAYFVRHRLSQKRRHLWDQIPRLQCYALNLCEIHDFTCCSEDSKKHLLYQCEFSDNGIVFSYTKGVYSYYDIEQIEEFVAFKGAYEIASLIEKYDATLTNLKTLPYLNIAMKTMLVMLMLKNILRTPSLSRKILIFYRKLWKKKLLKL